MKVKGFSAFAEAVQLYSDNNVKSFSAFFINKHKQTQLQLLTHRLQWRSRCEPRISGCLRLWSIHITRACLASSVCKKKKEKEMTVTVCLVNVSMEAINGTLAKKTGWLLLTWWRSCASPLPSRGVAECTYVRTVAAVEPEPVEGKEGFNEVYWCARKVLTELRWPGLDTHRIPVKSTVKSLTC